MFAAIFSDKSALIVVTLIGMAMCTGGIGQVAARGEWAHPLSIVGYALGVFALGIVGAALFDVKLPLIDSPRAALIAVVLIGVAKIALTQLHRALA